MNPPCCSFMTPHPDACKSPLYDIENSRIGQEFLTVADRPLIALDCGFDVAGELNELLPAVVFEGFFG